MPSALAGRVKNTNIVAEKSKLTNSFQTLFRLNAKGRFFVQKNLDLFLKLFYPDSGL